MLFSIVFATLSDEEQRFVADLYEKYGNMMYATAMGIINNTNDAEDAVQETMCKIMKHIDQFEGDDRVRSLAKVEIGLRTSIYNTACRQYRKKQKRIANEISMYYQVDEESDPLLYTIEDEFSMEKIIIQSTECEIIRDALLSLSPALQDAITLVYFCGMSQVEAADLMGIKAEAVRNRIFHARKKLKEKLEGDFNERIKK